MFAASFSPVVGNACLRVLAKSSIAVVLVLGSASFSAATAKFDNMNGEYLTSPTPKAPPGKTFNTKWDEYPGGDVEYFEVYMGPITSLYSEVRLVVDAELCLACCKKAGHRPFRFGTVICKDR